jgi:AAHS family cis,cis-muconate transporter-like MFS transporter
MQRRYGFEQVRDQAVISHLEDRCTLVACNTLISEYVPTRYRTTVLGTLKAGWSVGYIVVTLLAGWIWPIHGWRWLFYIAIVPVILALVMQRFVPLPQTWINAQAERAKHKLAGIRTGSAMQRDSTYTQIFSDPQKQ